MIVSKRCAEAYNARLYLENVFFLLNCLILAVPNYLYIPVVSIVWWWIGPIRLVVQR